MAKKSAIPADLTRSMSEMELDETKLKTLQQRLGLFYKNNVDISKEKMKKDEAVAQEIVELLVTAANDDKFIKTWNLQGSVRDGLMVRNGGDFDYLLTIEVRKKDITIFKGTNRDLVICQGIPDGYTILQYTPSAGSPSDQLPQAVTAQYEGKTFVDPIKIKRYLIGRFQKALNTIQDKLKEKNYVVKCSAGDRSPALTYNVEYLGSTKEVSIDVVPEIRLNIGKQPPPEELKESDKCNKDIKDLFWRESFTDAEKKDVENLSNEQKQCVRIMKAAKNMPNNSALKRLSSYHFKVIAINSKKKKLWPETNRPMSLAKLFDFFVSELIKALEMKVLHSPYLDMNLLQAVSKEHDATNTANFLKKQKKKLYENMLTCN